MKIHSIFLAVISFFSITQSCAKNDVPERIDLPDTSVLSVEASWGVVTSNYLRLREKASVESNSLTGLTKGTVLRLESATDRKETIEKITSVWYRVDAEGMRGWVFGGYLEVFTSKADAERRALDMK